MRRVRLAAAAAAALATGAIWIAAENGESPGAKSDRNAGTSANAGRSAGAQESHGGAGGMHGVFEADPPTLDALVGRAPAAVEATVTDVDTRVVDPSGLTPHADGSGLVSKQRITLRVEDRVYGRTPATLTFEKMGSQTEWAEGDPPYEDGERYLLFVEPLGDGYWGRTTRIGRLKVDRSSGKVVPLVDGELANKVRGREKNALKGDINAKAKAKGK